jgi:hypothetical protein
MIRNKFLLVSFPLKITEPFNWVNQQLDIKRIIVSINPHHNNVKDNLKPAPVHSKTGPELKIDN